MLVHPNALISSWTRNENLSKLGHYMLDDASQASPRAQHAALQRVNTYLTETKPPIGKKLLPPMPGKHLHKSGVGGAPCTLPQQATTADVLQALQVLQDSMKAFQSQVGHHNDAASASSPRGGDESNRSQAGDADPDSMSKVDLWRHKHSLLPPGVNTPTFANPDMVRYVPTKYVQKRIYDIRFDPDRWFELKDAVSHLQEEAALRDKHEVIQRNRRLAGSVSPSRRRDILQEKKSSLAERQKDAKLRRDIADEERSLALMTQDERQRIRHQEQAAQLVVMTALGARLGRMVNAFTAVRNRRQHAQRTRAAVVIQRAVKKHLLGAVQLTGVQAFLMRTRLVRRFVTKMKVKVFLPKNADMVRSFLKSIRFENRILCAFRKIHDRVVTAQRLVRRWQSDKKFIAMIRSMQWDKCVGKRVRDFSVMAAKGSSLERDLATKELEDLMSITPGHKTNVLDKFRAEARQVFLEAMRLHTDARKEAQTAEDARTAALLRKKIPKKPRIRVLVASEQIERMVRNAARQTRLERTMNAAQSASKVLAE
jgi:hypothetical protein